MEQLVCSISTLSIFCNSDTGKFATGVAVALSSEICWRQTQPYPAIPESWKGITPTSGFTRLDECVHPCIRIASSGAPCYAHSAEVGGMSNVSISSAAGPKTCHVNVPIDPTKILI